MKLITTQNTFIKQLLKPLLIPLLLVLLIIVVKQFPGFIEQYYSNRWYANVASFYRMLTGWISVSIGDILYVLIVIKILVWLVKTIIALVKKKWSRTVVQQVTISLLKNLMWLYIVFNLLWGLNYNRLGVKHQLQLTTQQHNEKALEDIVCNLVQQLNDTRKKIGTDTLPQLPYQQVIDDAKQAYTRVSGQYPFLTYHHATIKKSLYSGIGHYIGFTGYYNPFTAEAQISTEVPTIMLPFITVHEIAHQLGYASEEEANFIGYLVGTSSNNNLFKYSVYLELYKYAAVELFIKNKNAVHSWELDSLVRKDYRDIRYFFQKKNNKVVPYMNELYHQYLLANQQTHGIESYNDVVGLLIAYKKKYGVM